MSVTSMRLGLLVLTTALLLSARPLAAQMTDSTDVIGNWMERHKISLRRTFDGSKDEQNPATFFWVSEPEGPDDDYVLIDFAVKVNEFEKELNRGSQLLLYPVAEYHRTTREDKPSDKGSGALKLEYRPMMARPWRLVPVLFGDARLSRDFANDVTEQRYAALVSLFGFGRFAPGSPIRRPSRPDGEPGGVIGRWYPYIGIENYQTDSKTTDLDGTFLLGRLWIDFWPLRTLNRRYLQLTGEGTYRGRLGGELGSEDNLWELALSANLYLDPGEHIGIGADHVRGQDPKNTFIYRRRTSLGLKIKF